MLCTARGGAIVDIAASVDEKSGVFARKLWVELKSRPRPTRRSADGSASTSAILLIDHRLEALVGRKRRHQRGHLMTALRNSLKASGKGPALPPVERRRQAPSRRGAPTEKPRPHRPGAGRHDHSASASRRLGHATLLGLIRQTNCGSLARSARRCCRR